MAATNGKNIGLASGWGTGEDGWGAAMNNNLLILDVLTQGRVDGVLTAPLASPARGDAYLIGTPATGDWNGKDGQIAIHTGLAWVYVTPKSGWRVRVPDVGDNVYSGTAWEDDAGRTGATISIGTVTTGAAGTQASVSNSGTSTDVILDFTIPQGEAGAAGEDGTAGEQGPAGPDGAAATISIGTVTTGAAGSQASVTNSGTNSAAILDFTIPQGVAGADGGLPTADALTLGGVKIGSNIKKASDGTISVNKVSTNASVSGTVTLDADTADIYALTVTGNMTLALGSPAADGHGRVLSIVLTNGGAYTVTWPANVKWAGGTAPTLTAAGTDLITLLTVDVGTSWLGVPGGLAFA